MSALSEVLSSLAPVTSLAERKRASKENAAPAGYPLNCNLLYYIPLSKKRACESIAIYAIIQFGDYKKIFSSYR